MSYKSLLVHLDLGKDNAGLLDFTADLARRFDARVIGIAAGQPSVTLVGDDVSAGEALMADLEEIRRQLEAAKAAFHRRLDGVARRTEWRSEAGYEMLSSYIASQAHLADLIVSGPQLAFSFLHNAKRTNLGGLALEAGRPLLIVPDGITALKADHAFVGWNDSREARRAVADSLPLLKLAKEVSIVEIADEARMGKARNQISEIRDWLDCHAIKAQSLVLPARTVDGGDLRRELGERQCDLFVAGAYGHSRLREFVLSGVTRDLLLNPDYCVLISH
ncbi:MAG TPA: universal stress protein [Rhizomicrobium sp.]|nr:universal stress protein [Rhizomicrobium sp.]